MGNPIGLTMQTRRIDADTAVVALQGELDIYTTPRAKELLLRLLDDGCRYLIVNLREAAYLDSTALGALLGTLRRARERGGGLHLVAPTRAVHRLLEITRLTMAFPIYDTEHEAITIVGRGDGGA